MGPWYVYRVHRVGKLAYIGKGSGSRYLQSAKRVGGIAGIVRYFSKEDAAFRCERRLIEKLDPPDNIVCGGAGGHFSLARYWANVRKRAYQAADSGDPLAILVAIGHWRIHMKELGRSMEPYESRVREIVRAAMNFPCYQRVGF